MKLVLPNIDFQACLNCANSVYHMLYFHLCLRVSINLETGALTTYIEMMGDSRLETQDWKLSHGKSFHEDSRQHYHSSVFSV